MKDEVSQQIFLKETVGRSLSENQRHLDKSLLEHEGHMIKEMASKETAMTWKFFGSLFSVVLAAIALPKKQLPITKSPSLPEPPKEPLEQPSKEPPKGLPSPKEPSTLERTMKGLEREENLA
ncbi:hypothetical protein V8E54_012532 [Elaphomyces granulatus]